MDDIDRTGKLLKLLSCLNRASEKSGFVREAVESGEMFHPLKFTMQEAYQFLKEIPVIEEAGGQFSRGAQGSLPAAGRTVPGA